MTQIGTCGTCDTCGGASLQLRAFGGFRLCVTCFEWAQQELRPEDLVSMDSIETGQQHVAQAVLHNGDCDRCGAARELAQMVLRYPTLDTTHHYAACAECVADFVAASCPSPNGPAFDICSFLPKVEVYVRTKNGTYGLLGTREARLEAEDKR